MWRTRIRVSAVVRDARQRVLLVRQIDDLWVLLGGGVEPGETILDGIRREFKEETGLEIEPKRLLWLGDGIDFEYKTHHIGVTYLAEVIGGSTGKGEHECRYYSRDDLAQLNVAPKWLKDELWQALEASEAHNPARIAILAAT